jgi:hypothetical protein
MGINTQGDVSKRTFSVIAGQRSPTVNRFPGGVMFYSLINSLLDVAVWFIGRRKVGSKGSAGEACPRESGCGRMEEMRKGRREGEKKGGREGRRGSAWVCVLMPKQER